MSSQRLADGNVHLSSRQKQLLMLIGEDLTAKQLGERLEISPKTVEFHREALKSKIGVRGTAGLVSAII
jgi:DNA-binding CsgD family transcriptional regulator